MLTTKLLVKSAASVQASWLEIHTSKKFVLRLLYFPAEKSRISYVTPESLIYYLYYYHHFHIHAKR